jgi:malonyl-CoA O-methyltransferase
MAGADTAPPGKAGTGRPAGGNALLDPRQVRRGFARAAGRFDGADFIQTQVRERLLERLQWVRLEPQVIVDLGAGTGRAAAGLATRFPGARIIAADLVPEMLAVARRRPQAPAAVCADAGQLPFADQSVDLVFSSLVLHWCPALDAVFAEVRRILRQPGLFTFATLGPASFGELRTAWSAADGAPRVMTFPEMRALAAGLGSAGLVEAVVDSDRLTIRYRELHQLLDDLRATGTSNASASRPRGLTGRRAWERMRERYESMREESGALPATLEIICGQAWAPGTPSGRRQAGSEIVVPLADLGHRTGPERSR